MSWTVEDFAQLREIARVIDNMDLEWPETSFVDSDSAIIRAAGDEIKILQTQLEREKDKNRFLEQRLTKGRTERCRHGVSNLNICIHCD